MPRLTYATLARGLGLFVAAFALVLMLQPAAISGPDDGPDDPPAPGDEEAPKEAVPAPQGPAGMVYVPGGPGVVGTLNKRVIDLTRGRPADVLQAFLFETPQHKPQFTGFFIDRFEVTNAQYHAFLQATSTTVYDTSGGGLGTIDEIAASLLALKETERKSRDVRYWEQLYYANKDALWEAFGKLKGKEEGKTKLDELKVLRPDDTVDEKRTAAKFRFEALPRNLKLNFYNRRPPIDWQGITPPEGSWNHPVRDVSYLDAQRFAEWAGKHVPTEPEWEYAARGPQGLQFPWGNDFPTEKEAAKRRGNWGTNFIDERTYMARTVEVNEISGSMSWCGAYHLVGNVAEWTSSWFKAYPGFRRESRFSSRLGETIKVVRGGHAASDEILVLRPAARNWMGSGPKAPPYPGNRFPWVGFRCAYYVKAGQNHLEPIIWRASRGRRVHESRLAVGRFEGSVIENFAETGSLSDNNITVLGESKAIAIIPATKVLFEQGDEWMSTSWKKARRFKKTKDLAKRSTETTQPRIVLGVLHTDLPLDKVAVRRPLTEEEKKKLGSGRGRKRAPPTVEGKIEPGTYLLALWHGRLCVTNTSLEFEAFISPEKSTTCEVVKKIDPANVPATAWELDNLADEGKFEFHVALGGKKMDEDIFVKVTGLLKYELGSLDSAGEWRSGGGENLPTADMCILDAQREAAKPNGADDGEKKPDAGEGDGEKKDGEEPGAGDGEGSGEPTPEKPDEPGGDEPTPEKPDEPGGDEPEPDKPDNPGGDG